VYFFFPKEKGTYLCLIICLICFFIVTVKSMTQYSNRTGQKTGRSNMGKNVIAKPIRTDFVAARLKTKEESELGAGKERTGGEGVDRREVTPVQLQVRCAARELAQAKWKRKRTHQNLNSGSLLTKGLNSWSLLVGRAGPSVSGSI